MVSHDHLEDEIVRTRAADRQSIPWRRVLSQTFPPERAAALRIGVSAVWFYELVRLAPWQSELYDTGVPGQSVVFAVWVAATAGLLVGFRTRWAAAFSATCFLIFVNLGGEIYHIDYYAQLATVYLVVIDAGAVWSVDSVLRRRAGRTPVSAIWAVPVLGLLIHLAVTYVDAAGSHILLNNLWEEGAAVGYSWNHPQWGTPLSAVLGEWSWVSRTATWATVIIESSVWFLVMVFAFDWRRRRMLGWVIVGALAALHAGIAAMYSIGTFGLFMLVLIAPYLPWERFRRATPTAMPKGNPAWDWRLVAALALVLVMAMFTVQPLEPATAGIGLRDTRDASVELLGLIGDQRPHDVFSDEALALAFSVTVRDEAGERLELLFDDDGRRLGDLAYIRVYMGWFRIGQPIAQRLDAGSVVPPLDEARFRSTIAPVLERAVREGTMRPGSTYELEYQAWRVGESEAMAGIVAVRSTWLVVEVDADAGVRLVQALPLG